MAFIERACPSTKGRSSRAQRSASQVPGEDTLDADDEILPVRRDGLEKRLWTGWHVAVQHDLPVLVEDADIHGAGMQVDATVKWVWLRVKAHEVSSSS
jgi:hypothetical protein